MLTVMREMAAHVASELAHMKDARLGPDADRRAAEPRHRRGARARHRGRRGVGRPRPRAAAGAARGGGRRRRRPRGDDRPGRRGRRAARRGRARDRPPRARRGSPIPSTSPRPTATARTSRSPASRCRRQPFVHALERLGDSVLVVGDETTLKVHVHTDDPEQAIAAFAGAGEVSHLDVADMREQVAERGARLAGNGNGTARAESASGALAVVAGAGMARLFQSLGCHVLDGGTTLNPSTHELLAGIHGVPGRGGRRPAQQPERDHGRRARRRARREGRRGRRRALAAGGPVRRGGARTAR